MLNKLTKEIKSLCNETKINFLKMGEILVNIRDKELWKEKYKSFTEYLTSESFEFGRQYAYKLMDVYNTFGKDVALCDKLGIYKLVELTYVPNKQIRKELVKKAKTMTGDELKEEVKKVRDEDLFKQIHRKAQREDGDIVIEQDDIYAKCKRQAKNILQDIDNIKKPLNDMNIRIEKWLEFSNKIKGDKEIETFKAAIFLEWKKLRQM